MREVGLTFTDEMVRAILATQKWQTRRPLAAKPPKAEAGDRIWVRETWGVGTRPHPASGCVDGIEYRADEAWLEESDMLPLYEVEPPDHVSFADYDSGWKPSIHMPKWAARIWLPLLRVWDTRLHLMSEGEAEAEGVEAILVQPDGGSDPHVLGFYELWESIYGNRPGLSWADNPWVRVYEWDPQRVEVRG